VTSSRSLQGKLGKPSIRDEAMELGLTGEVNGRLQLLHLLALILYKVEDEWN